MERRGSYRAFTLIELLCVIALIGVLVSMLLPAVQSAREASRRSQCQNNLRQLALGLLHHENVYRTLPAGYRFTTPTRSFLPPLLPFIEQGSVPYATDSNWDSSANAQAIRVTIAMIACPSVPDRKDFDDSNSLLPATTDYTVFHGVNAGYCNLVAWPHYTPPDENGLITSSPCPLAKAIDGTSHTVMIVEDAARPTLWRMGKRASGVAGAGGWADPNNEIALDGSDYLTTGNGQGFGPCVMNCTNDNEVYAFHLRAANFAFADGHVALISESISNATFAAIITKAAGDIVINGDLW